jgi:hypothetical protein
VCNVFHFVTHRTLGWDQAPAAWAMLPSVCAIAFRIRAIPASDRPGGDGHAPVVDEARSSEKWRHRNEMTRTIPCTEYLPNILRRCSPFP